ncbi:MAG: helix-turn-helix domain containing protein [Acidimicrobiales bacterium]|nr:helix-turn-helix domain containing protein [Acidimicrobiales bacterium]
MVQPLGPRARSDELTDRLLQAAIEVFTDRGIEKAGVAAIARRAGVTTGAIYSRWEGKQELLLDALDVVLVQQVADLLAAGPQASAADVLESLGAHLLDREAASDALLLEAMVTARRDPDFRELFNARVRDEEGHLALLIDNGKEAGIVDPALSTAAIVTLCQAISFGFVVMGAIDKSTAPADEWNAVIHRLISAALPAPAPKPAAVRG